MKSSRFVRLAGIAALTGAAATLGFGGTALAQPTDDVPILVENLPAAAEALATGLQDAATAAAEHQSATQGSADVGATVVEAGTVLTTGTEQFGALGLGLMLGNAAAQGALAPYLGAIDDPATAGDLFNPEDLATVAGNLAPAGEHVQEHMTIAVIEGLQGNLIAPSFLDPVTGTPAAVGNTLQAVVNGAPIVVADTNFESVGGAVQIVGLVGGVAVGGAAGEYAQQLEDGIAPVAEAAQPITTPIIEALSGE